MTQSENQKPSIFSPSQTTTFHLNTVGVTRAEWWLNVNYAEIIEIKDAVGLQAGSLRNRIAAG